MTYVSNELDSWLDKEFLLEISEDIVNLNDYVPKTIELLLPDYNARSKFVLANSELMESETFKIKEILDQMAMGTTWEEHVSIYDEFFEFHPEFSKLIRDKEAYEKWKLEEVPY